MSAAKDRKGELRGLLLEMQSDSGAIKKLKQTLMDIQKGESSSHEPSTASQMGMALCLHHLYTAMEEIFLRINKVYDQVPESSKNWRRELLRNMSLNLEGVRPSVISNELLSKVNEYRSFRHIVRHAYDYELDWRRLQPLIQNIFETVHLFETEMEKFKEFVLENIRHLDQTE